MRAGDEAQHDDHEQQRREIECGYQRREVRDRGKAVASNGERHRAERADRRGVEHDAHDPEHDGGEPLQRLKKRPSAIPHQR